MGEPLSETDTAARCGHCGLAAPAGDAFCCYGCELAHALTRGDDDRRQRTLGALTLSLLLAMVVMMMSLFLYAEDIYEVAPDPLYLWFRRASSWAVAVLSSLVMVLLGPPLLRRAARAARRQRLTMELLIAVAVGAALAVSWVNIARGASVIYFDSAVAALVLATFGRYIEARARSQAAGVVGPLLEPSSKPVLAGHGDTLSLTPPAAIEPGMVVEIRPDGVVAVDLRATGTAQVSLAVVSGESEPVAVEAGDEVPAGAVVLSNTLRGVALRRAEHSTLAALERLTRALRGRRGAVLRVADRLAAWLTPAVAAVALGAFAWWARRAGLGAGVEVALAVVLVACPCTYGVITPLIAWLSLRKALEHDVCLRDAAVADALADVQTVAFDKTGTVTEPLAEVQVKTRGGLDEDAVMALAAALERDVPHPIGRAIRAHARVPPADLVDVMVEPRGARGHTRDGEALILGAPSWLSAEGVDVPPAFHASLAVLARDGVALAAFDVDERIRGEAPAAVHELHRLGVSTALVSGDRKQRVEAVAARLSLSRFAGEVTPLDKVRFLQGLERAAFVGDGINDAPAAAAALTSFAVNGAASLNRGVADVVLLSPDLRLVPWALALARRARQLGVRTLAAATLYNVSFVALAALGMLRPVWAGVSMLIASIVALAGALRIAAHPGPRHTTHLEPVEVQA